MLHTLLTIDDGFAECVWMERSSGNQPVVAFFCRDVLSLLHVIDVIFVGLQLNTLGSAFLGYFCNRIRQKMGAYRLEYAKTKTSGCKGPMPCKGTKIDKGDLRFGTVVDIQGHTSFAWRHWGCVTPKIFEHLKTDFDKAEDLDGFEELRPEDQERISVAFTNGEVADDDVPASARKPRDENGEEIKSSPAKKTKSAPKKAELKKAAPNKSKKPKKEQVSDEDEDEKPTKKRAPKVTKKLKRAKDESEEEDDFSDSGKSEESEPSFDSDEESEAVSTDEELSKGRKGKKSREKKEDVEKEAPLTPRKPSSRANKAKKNMKEPSSEEDSDLDKKPTKKKMRKMARVTSD